MAPKLLDLVREVARLKHLSKRTEDSYLQWIKRYILHHQKRHPIEMGESEIRQFLSYLAQHKHVSSSTQNQAINALNFLYKDVLHKKLGDFGNIERAQREPRLPVVFSKKEVKAIINNLSGTTKLITSLLYGSGLRLLEAIRLRVQDIDFDNNVIIVRHGKGDKDRHVPLPRVLIRDLELQREKVRILHLQDTHEGYGDAVLPDALYTKSKYASKEPGWQFLFPSSKRSADPISGLIARHHLHDTLIQREVKDAIRKTNILKNGSCHSFRHLFVHPVRYLETYFG
jgi:integron integrase